jgi:hypothetical protein
VLDALAYRFPSGVFPSRNCAMADSDIAAQAQQPIKDCTPRIHSTPFGNR